MEVFTEISLLIVFATVVSVAMRILKQPLLIGHIITGILVGPHFFNLLHNAESIETFSKFGISILLFIVGIGLSPKIIREVGKISLVTGVGQVVFTSLAGYFICLGFGYSTVESLYISIALTFSSTIIILKLLSDKKDLEKLYAKIAIGFLLVQDVIATILLIGVSTFSLGGSNAGANVIFVLAKGIVITLVLFYISYALLPKVGRFLASSSENLFLFSLGWGFGVAVLYSYLGLSVEIGALLAGAALSVSPYASEVGAKLKTLRDFFIISFFILLGSNLQLDNLSSMMVPAILLSVFVLIGNPLIVLILMGILGYNRRTSFMSGLAVAQISEFSLIFVLLGVQLGHLTQEILTLVTIVGLITIAGSTYMILYAEALFVYFSKYLVLFEKKHAKKELTGKVFYEVILLGCNRVGYDFVRLFKHLKSKFLAVDFDPEVVLQVSKSGVNCIYGDAEDEGFLEDLNLEKAKMVISTIPDFETNEFLLNFIRKSSHEVVLIVISYNIDQALALYEKGATYVILPHFIGGQYAAELAHKSNLELKALLAKREEHIDYLKERKSFGHTHPVWGHAL